MASPQILVVDDDVEDHLILLDFFKDAGLETSVFFVKNGQNAIDYLETLDDQDLPCLVVLDLNMPILNGTQTLLHLKQTSNFRKIPVIVYSTSNNEQERRKCLSFGAIDYIVKPMTFEEGQRMIKKFIAFLPQSA